MPVMKAFFVILHEENSKIKNRSSTTDGQDGEKLKC
jgi:hypothetical protein